LEVFSTAGNAARTASNLFAAVIGAAVADTLRPVTAEKRPVTEEERPVTEEERPVAEEVRPVTEAGSWG
jgi:hypothetical protein